MAASAAASFPLRDDMTTGSDKGAKSVPLPDPAESRDVRLGLFGLADDARRQELRLLAALLQRMGQTIH